MLFIFKAYIGYTVYTYLAVWTKGMVGNPIRNEVMHESTKSKAIGETLPKVDNVDVLQDNANK